MRLDWWSPCGTSPSLSELGAVFRLSSSHPAAGVCCYKIHLCRIWASIWGYSSVSSLVFRIPLYFQIWTTKSILCRNSSTSINQSIHHDTSVPQGGLGFDVVFTRRRGQRSVSEDKALSTNAREKDFTPTIRAVD